MIEFVRSYNDRSTDRGYQFEFHCDRCANGYLSSYQPSLLGTAGGLLQVAGNLFGGLLGSAGNSTYEIQRAIGGPAHDRALEQAVTEVKQKFRRCQRCGNWVCAEICWNERAAQCTACTPKYEQEAISLRTQAQVEATRLQLREKALDTDYVSGIDMRPDATIHLNPAPAAPLPSSAPTQPASFLPTSLTSGPTPWQTTAASQAPNQAHLQPAAPSMPAWQPVQTPPAAEVVCPACSTKVHPGKFCSACGSSLSAPLQKTCNACGHLSPPGARFCEDCGKVLA